MKNRMIAYTAGVISVVIALMIIIVTLEPAKGGIGRAQAFKAMTLLMTSRQECQTDSQERSGSHFSAKEQGNWFVKYMDYLYDRGYLTEEMTPPSLATAQGELSYREASYLAGQVSGRLKLQVGATKHNQDKPFPEEEWWKLYGELAAALDPEGHMAEHTAVLYGTPSNLEGAASWTAYTTDGDYGFEGMTLDAYIDSQIRFLERDGEMIAVREQLSRDITYENVWLTAGEKGYFSVRLGTLPREFALSEKIGTTTDLDRNIVDLVLSEGKLKKIIVKKDRVSGKVLAVTDQYIEIEGYGQLELAPNFQVYKMYGEFQELSLKDILVGYNLQQFAAADGKLCAALVEHPFNGETIRVLLMDTGFKNIFHENVELTVTGPAMLIRESISGERKEEEIEDQRELSFEAGDGQLGSDRLIIRVEGDSGIRIDSIQRGQGHPAYGGSLEIKETEEGLVLVNDLYLEDYLKKVVPSEMPSSYAAEALKAQAVCARTYGCRQIQGNAYSQYGAHVDDSTMYQVYNNKETDEKTSAAVNETSGQILTYNGEAAETFYFSTSCGHTSDGSVWSAQGAALPYLQAVELRNRRETLDLTDNDTFREFIRSQEIPAYDSSYPMYRWNTTIPASLLEGSLTAVGKAENMTVTRRGPGGIAQEIVVKGASGEQTIKTQSAIRSALGNPKLVIQRKDGTTLTDSATLPSAFIDIEKITAQDGEISFRIWGGGYGHGVGMSQNGAQGMAESGSSYEEILDFFYRGTELTSQED